MNLQSISDITSRLQWLTFYNCFPFPIQGQSLPRYCSRKRVTILSSTVMLLLFLYTIPHLLGVAALSPCIMHVCGYSMHHLMWLNCRVYTQYLYTELYSHFWGLTNLGCVTQATFLTFNAYHMTHKHGQVTTALPPDQPLQ